MEDAGAITAVYKINSEGEWIELPASVIGSTIEITMTAGDPPVIFAYPVPDTSYDDNTERAVSTAGSGGGGDARVYRSCNYRSGSCGGVSD